MRQLATTTALHFVAVFALAMAGTASAEVIEFDDLGSSNDGVGVLEDPLYGGAATWLTFNGTGNPGRGSGQTGDSRDGSARGLYLYPFSQPSIPENDAPVLAHVKPLQQANQFELDDYTNIEFYWENVEFFGTFSALRFVVNVEGTWYVENDLTFSADSVSGDSDGDDAARGSFDSAAANWTVLNLGSPADYRAAEDADFDDDEDVDLADLMILQRGFGSSGAENNAVGNVNQSAAPLPLRDDDVNALDQALWHDLFTNGPTTPIDADTISLGGPAATDLQGTVQGYGVYLSIDDLSNTAPFVIGTDIVSIGIDGTPVAAASSIPEPSSAFLLLIGFAAASRSLRRFRTDQHKQRSAQRSLSKHLQAETSMKHSGAIACFCAVAIFACPAVSRGGVGLTLNLTYANPSDANSGGTWNLAVLSTAGEGVNSVLAYLGGIDDPSGLLYDPSGTADLGGTGVFSFDEGSGVYQVAYAQDFASPVLNVGNGASAISDPFGNSAWNGQTIVVTGGTFSPGQTPELDPVSASGLSEINIFTGGGSGAVQATFATIDAQLTPVVRSNLGLSFPGDFNGDGSVDAADYTVWRDGGTGLGPQGYDLWVANFGQVSAMATAVPEPSCGLLALAAAGFAIGGRSRSDRPLR